MLDYLASTYKYTHDEAFKLSWNQAMMILSYNRERAYIDFRTEQEISRSSE